MRADWAFFICDGISSHPMKQKKRPWGRFFHLPALLLVAVLTKPLLAFVRSHFMALALFTAWHGDLWMT